MGQRRDDPIRLAPIEFLLQQAEYSSRHSQRVAGQRWGQVGRNGGSEFHRLAFVGRLSRNAPAVVEDPSHEKRELRPQVHGLFRRQAIAQDVQHRSQRPVGGPMITASGYTTETAVSAIEPAPAHPGWGAAERLRPFDGLWRRRTRLPHVLLFWLHWRKAKLADAVAFGRMFIANPESRRAIFLRRSQGIVGSATTTISGNVVRAAKFSPTLASC